MKKIVVIILSIVSVFMIFLSACDNKGHAHEYTWFMAKQATCTEAGQLEGICSCGEKSYQSLSATGHNYVSGVCNVCGSVNSQFPPAHVHEYVWTTVLESTCSTKGISMGSCECGHSATKILEQKEHVRDKEGVCALCGDGKVIEGHTHSYSWNVVVEPTCSAEGLSLGNCDCGHTTTKVLDTQEHAYNAFGVCSACNYGVNQIPSGVTLGYTLETLYDYVCQKGENITFDKFEYNLPQYTASLETFGAKNISVRFTYAEYDGVMILNDIKKDFYFEEKPASIRFVTQISVNYLNRHLEVLLADGTLLDFGLVDSDDFSSDTVKSIFVNQEDLLCIVYRDNKMLVAGKIPNSSDEVVSSGLMYKKIDGKNEYSVVGYIGNLTEVEIPITHRGLPITEIAVSAFSESEMTNVVMGENIKKINSFAFYGCNKLNSVVLNDNLATIESCAFAQTKLSYIIIPETVTTIHEYAFNNDVTIYTNATKRLPMWYTFCTIYFKGEWSLGSVPLPNN